jgi:hypothetical protein
MNIKINNIKQVQKILDLYEIAISSANESFDEQNKKFISHFDTPVGFTLQQLVAIKFAESLVEDAFLSGIIYCSKKYEKVGLEKFTGNDVSIFLQMEASELSKEDIEQFLEKNNE